VTVLMPHRIGNESSLPKTELVRGDGAVGVKLTAPDGAEDIVAFRAGDAKTITCAGLRSDARVFARGVKKDGSVSRQLRVQQ